MELANNTRIICFALLRNYNHPRVCQNFCHGSVHRFKFCFHVSKTKFGNR
jgi:hypothetical protein